MKLRSTPATADGAAPRARGEQRVLQVLSSAGVASPMLALAAGLVATFVLLLLHSRTPDSEWLQTLSLMFLLLSLIALVLAGLRLRSQLLLPLAVLEESVARISQGEPGSSEALQNVGVLDGIASDIDGSNTEVMVFCVGKASTDRGGRDAILDLVRICCFGAT